jgi:hypothetical protein
VTSSTTIGCCLIGQPAGRAEFSYAQNFMVALTHHALKAIDDTAKRFNKEIPLPTLRHRLDALGRQIRDDLIRRCTDTHPLHATTP